MPKISLCPNELVNYYSGTECTSVPNQKTPQSDTVLPTEVTNKSVPNPGFREQVFRPVRIILDFLSNLCDENSQILRLVNKTWSPDGS